MKLWNSLNRLPWRVKGAIGMFGYWLGCMAGLYVMSIPFWGHWVFGGMILAIAVPCPWWAAWSCYHDGKFRTAVA